MSSTEVAVVAPGVKFQFPLKNMNNDIQNDFCPPEHPPSLPALQAYTIKKCHNTVKPLANLDTLNARYNTVISLSTRGNR